MQLLKNMKSLPAVCGWQVVQAGLKLLWLWTVMVMYDVLVGIRHSVTISVTVCIIDGAAIGTTNCVTVRVAAGVVVDIIDGVG